MFVTIIICTYRRAADLERLLNNLNRQTVREFDVLIVDGSGDESAVATLVERWTATIGNGLSLRLVPSATGLTRQRNVGLRQARGDAICFLDDDVTVEERFVEQVAELFEASEHQDVGGIAGYDTLNYPAAVSLRWHLRKRFGVVRGLQPGDADRLGRNVPLSFAVPFRGCVPVGWLPGFCMIYRRTALENLQFDERLPTYGGEDRDFSMQVAQRWRLLFCGDLQVQHHHSTVNRVAGTRQVYQTAFGIGRGFRKRASGMADLFIIFTYTLREFAIEALAGVKHPNATSFAAPFARVMGLVAGWRSLPLPEQPTRAHLSETRTLTSRLDTLSDSTARAHE